MTTTVHVYSSYVHTDKKLQMVRRYHADGREEPLHDDIPGHMILTHYATADAELVLREVPRVTPETAP